jgi:dihydroorotate dehydrogenase/Pyruvate/2-oxoacid:ferredoxin oxidoreductase delta subunit
MDKSALYAGIKLAHPIIASSAGTTRDAEQAVKCEESGYSAVVLKSVQEEVLMRYNPFPRFAVLRSGIKGYESTTFYCCEQAYYGDLDDYAETVRRCKERVSIPVIASINCIKPESWAHYASVCEQAGADAVEIVPSCPFGFLIRDPSNDNHSIALAALAACKEKVKIPVIPKMTGQVANPLYTALCLDEAGADGLVMINRSTGIEIDIEAQKPILHGGLAGHGGSWALNSVLRWIIVTHPHVTAPITATGGIMTGGDTIKCLLAGANTVEIATVVYLKGYDYVQTMLAEIDDYMDHKGIETLSDIVGLAGKNMLTMEQYDRKTRYFASCDQETCVACGRCEKVCIYDALKLVNSKPVIDRDKCDGCGLCKSVCRLDAIKLNVKE